MPKLKKLLKRILMPHGAVLLLLALLSAFLLPYSFLAFGSDSLVSYVVYALSAYTLTAACFRAPSLIRYFKGLRDSNRYVNRLTGDTRLRVKLSLYGSLGINTAYALLQLGLGIRHRSYWFYSFAVYYAMLVLMRFLLLRDVKGKRPDEEDTVSELKRYRFCGAVLLLMNTALTSIVFFITYRGYTFEHSEITTIAMAAYTFTSFSMATVNLIKYKKYRSPLYSAAKTVNLVAASVSMLTLETTMLSTFGADSDYGFRQLMTGITGITVCLFILCISVYMIYNATNKLRAIKGSKNE